MARRGVCNEEQAFPETANQEMGWFLSAPGPHKELRRSDWEQMAL